MISFLIAWAVLGLAFWVASLIVPGFALKEGFTNIVIVSAIFGVLNALLGWFLFVVIGLTTLGLGFLFGFLTRWLVMALLLKLTDAITDRVEINGFVPAIWAALVLSAIGALADLVLK